MIFALPGTMQRRLAAQAEVNCILANHLTTAAAALFPTPICCREKAILEQIISLQFPLLTPPHRAIHYQLEWRGREGGGGNPGLITFVAKLLDDLFLILVLLL